MKTRQVDKNDAANYLKRAEELLDTMRYAFNSGNWNACLVNAVQSAISSADAVCVWRLGERGASDSHADALRLLSETSPESEDIKNAIKHLSYLIQIKTNVECGERLFSQSEAEQAVKHAERLLSYAKSVVKN